MFQNIAPVTDPFIIASVIIFLLSFLLPCAIWLIRNIIRVSLKKEYHLFNKILKISWLVGLVFFIVAIILFVIKATGVV